MSKDFHMQSRWILAVLKEISSRHRPRLWWVVAGCDAADTGLRRRVASMTTIRFLCAFGLQMHSFSLRKITAKEPFRKCPLCKSHIWKYLFLATYRPHKFPATVNRILNTELLLTWKRTLRYWAHTSAPVTFTYIHAYMFMCPRTEKARKEIFLPTHLSCYLWMSMYM